jgi:hypothetical protein
MKIATILLLGIALPGCFAALNAADPGSVVMGFTGGSTWTSPSTGICIWTIAQLGGLDWTSLFNTTPLFGRSDAARATKENAYLIWVSDFSVQILPSNSFAPAPPAGDSPLPYVVAAAPAGTATIYLSTNPASRDWSDLTNRKTWGDAVATFTRNASLVRSADNFASDTFVFTADLVSSKPFSWNGKTLDFKDLMPHGMTCSEYGQQGSGWESGTCVVKGAAQ